MSDRICNVPIWLNSVVRFNGQSHIRLEFQDHDRTTTDLSAEKHACQVMKDGTSRAGRVCGPRALGRHQATPK